LSFLAQRGENKAQNTLFLSTLEAGRRLVCIYTPKLVVPLQPLLLERFKGSKDLVEEVEGGVVWRANKVWFFDFPYMLANLKRLSVIVKGELIGLYRGGLRSDILAIVAGGKTHGAHSR